MRRMMLTLATLVALFACGDATGILELTPTAIVVRSGQDQVVEAGAPELLEPTELRLVGTTDGQALLIGPQPAYAQDTIGTGIPNAVVCAAPTDSAGNRVPDGAPGALTPFSDCVMTDSAGDAVFHWEAGTKAGKAHGQVRSDIAGKPNVHANIQATVTPGPLARFRVGQSGTHQVGDTVDLRELVHDGRDEYGNGIARDTLTAVPDSLVDWGFSDANTDSDATFDPAGSGWLVVVPDFGEHGFEVAYDGDYATRIHVRIDGVAGQRARFDVDAD